jgi:HK97 family phage major capsid protein
MVDLNNEAAVREQARYELDQQAMAEYRRQLDGEAVRKRARQGAQLTYQENGAHSFFIDLARHGAKRSGEHDKRLFAHAEELRLHPRLQETRTGLGTTEGTGGSFSAPYHAQDAFIAGAHPLRATADVFRPLPIPHAAAQVLVPALTSGSGVVDDSTQNSSISETDPVDADVSYNTTTITGNVTLSRQLYQQASPDSSIDRVIGADLGDAYGAKLSSTVINTILNTSGVNTVSVSSGTTQSVTSAVGTGYQQVLFTRNRKPDTIVMHPYRWISTFGGAVDGNNRPLLLPKTSNDALVSQADDAVAAEWLGCRVVLDVNVPLTSGSGSQDYIIVGYSKDWLLAESEVSFTAYQEALAAQMSVLVQAVGYVAPVIRLASSIALVGPFASGS